MKYLFFITIFIFINLTVKSQCENELLGYSKETGFLTIKNGLRCHLSDIDTSLKAGLSASLVKTEKTDGIMIEGAFLKSIGRIDQSATLKITFQDNTFITLNEYPGQDNSVGLFFSVVTDKYSLLLLKTKVISKIEIKGDLLNAATFESDVSALNFLLALECLENYL
jgi:hypothetical protein